MINDNTLVNQYQNITKSCFHVQHYLWYKYLEKKGFVNDFSDDKYSTYLMSRGEFLSLSN